MVQLFSSFLGNKTVENYKTLEMDMMHAFRDTDCNVSPEIQILHSHLDFYHDNMNHVKNEYGSRFHKDILIMEERY